ncbi:MAG: sensor histidine kinase, partial [Proteobacteria bacterium]|nr:sensor histidine kinase [Pseudomonadota bacterium]
MLPEWLILLISLVYLGGLFAIASYGDNRADLGRSIISNPYVYTLSIAVYCTAWTYYGSVGRAAATGIGFLPIYLGPTLMAALWWFVLRKIIRIAKVHRITSIADFIASRYGKSALAGGLVTVIAMVGTVPYISLQLKAISRTFTFMHVYPELELLQQHSQSFWYDTAFAVAIILAVFSIFFGTRHVDATERHEGMVAAIAFESVVKLLAFSIAGIYVTFFLFSGPFDLFERMAGVPELGNLMTFDVLPGGYVNWFTLTLLSMSAIMFLPRQFQVLVVENVNEEHVRKAAWLFPLYLFAINLFVLPIAMAGILRFGTTGVDPDIFVLMLPMAAQQKFISILVYLGGLSAATSMVIVATIALSTMICNQLVMATLLRIPLLRQRDLGGMVLAIRRGCIIVLLLFGYIYYRIIGDSVGLVSIGLVSFAAVAQLAPPLLFGIFWKGASCRGAIYGLAAGFLVWAYTLFIPTFAGSNAAVASFLTHGPFGIDLLRPYQLLGLDMFDPITHSVFWSMLANLSLLVGLSLLDSQSTMERIQASLFVDVYRHSGGPHIWHGKAMITELKKLLARFIGDPKADRALLDYGRSRDIELAAGMQADTDLVEYAEKLLAGAIGAASARIMVSSVVKGEEISQEGLLSILDETSQVIEYSHRLEQKSLELEEATNKLREANLRLRELDRLKDEFVSTVSHELRTPLTSIRSFSEILQDNPELNQSERRRYLGIVVKETERLTRLINQVLNLAKIEAGQADWQMQDLDIVELAGEALESTSRLFSDKGIALSIELPDHPVLIFADHDRLMRVFINLLSNAVKFSPAVGGRVEVALRHQNEGVYCEIGDNGCGVPPGDE